MSWWQAFLCLVWRRACRIPGFEDREFREWVRHEGEEAARASARELDAYRRETLRDVGPASSLLGARRDRMTEP